MGLCRDIVRSGKVRSYGYLHRLQAIGNPLVANLFKSFLIKSGCRTASIRILPISRYIAGLSSVTAIRSEENAFRGTPGDRK